MKKYMLILLVLLCCVHLGSLGRVEAREIDTRNSENRYRKRGNRYEGTITNPVGGKEFQLISAKIDYDESFSGSQHYYLRFYLENANPNVTVTVESITTNCHYRMDKVIPTAPWGAGYNEFAWPSDIIQELELQTNQLHGVIRLNKKYPSAIETVAPVLIYSKTSTIPSKVKNYVFTFFTGGIHWLSYSIFKRSHKIPFEKKKNIGLESEDILHIYWDAENMPEGYYRLHITAYFPDMFDPTQYHPYDMDILFFHKPKLR